MTKKNCLTITILAVLAVVYAIYFTDWFRPKTLSIFHTYRNLRHGPARLGAMPSLIFGITGSKVRLTDVRVLAEADAKTNNNPVTVWHIISDSNSIPISTFFYGQFIPGMHPEIKGTRPQDLETNVTYRLIVQAGKYKGDHPFRLQ